jgi:hypothetical protein
MEVTDPEAGRVTALTVTDADPVPALFTPIIEKS